VGRTKQHRRTDPQQTGRLGALVAHLRACIGNLQNGRPNPAVEAVPRFGRA
jgi:hypothetical protein